jgi:hypothetical protein
MQLGLYRQGQLLHLTEDLCYRVCCCHVRTDVVSFLLPFSSFSGAALARPAHCFVLHFIAVPASPCPRHPDPTLCVPADISSGPHCLRLPCRGRNHRDDGFHLRYAAIFYSFLMILYITNIYSLFFLKWGLTGLFSFIFNC